MKTSTQVWKGQHELTLHLLSGKNRYSSLYFGQMRINRLTRHDWTVVTPLEQTPFNIPPVTIETEDGKQYYMIANTFGN